MDKEQMTVYIPKELRKQLKIKAVTEERTMSDIVEQAIKDYLNK